MSAADLLDELEDLKEKYENLRSDYDELQDDKDRILSEMEGKIEAIKQDVEKQWRNRMRQSDEDNKARIEILTAEVDMMRGAFNGDASGWEERRTKTQTFYENTVTGEIRDTEPEVLYIARAMQRVDEADTLAADYKKMTKKFEDMEMKKKEGEIQINKLKTEVNAIRLVDKQWKESAKVIFQSLTSIRDQFDAQANQIIMGMNEIGRTSKRIHDNDPKVRSIDETLVRYKKRMKDQEAMIETLNGKIRTLTMELEDQTDKVRRLSRGLEEEVTRLCNPMRRKLSECMTMVMKEKAMRAQERRELAALWPDTQMMPTILLKYRGISDEERERRKVRAAEIDASRALAIEIRANVAQSKAWEMKYDDYGRQFFEHAFTGEAAYDRPAIMDYQPPAGRDELGNLTFEENAEILQWKMLADNKGQIYYVHKKTGKKRYTPPDGFRKIPPGKTAEQLVGEAAMLVLTYIKGKISRHIEKKKLRKQELEQPLSIAEKKRIQKAKDRERQLNNGVLLEDLMEKPKDPDEGDDLNKYLYDIETVEMLAAAVEDKSIKIVDYDAALNAKRAFLNESEVRKFDESLYTGPRLIETDVDEITVQGIRDIIETLATNEEKLEQRLKKTRENLKDFSFLLVDREREEAAKIKALQEEEKKKRLAEILAAQYQAAVEAEKKGGAPASAGETKAVENAGDTENPEKIEGPRGLLHSREQISTAGGKNNPSRPMTGMTAPGGNQNVENVDPEEDEGTIISELTNPYELKQADAHAHGFLLGDPELDDIPVSEQPQTLVQTVDSLADLAVFCGIVNMHIDDVPNDATMHFSLYPDDTDESKNVMVAGSIKDDASAYKMDTDDKWFTKSFFLALTPERLDVLTKMTSKSYDPVLGLSPEGPLSTNALLRLQGKADIEELGMTEEEVKIKPKSSSSGLIHEKLENNYRIWKARQLMSEVLMWQFQQEAVRDALDGRLLYSDPGPGAEGSQSLVQSRLSIVPTKAKILTSRRLPPLNISIIRCEAFNVNQKVWADQQSLFLRFSLGGWIARTSSQLCTGRALEWNNPEIKVLMPREDLKLNEMKVEVYEESVMVDDKRLGVGRVSIQSLVGHNVGKPIEFEVKLRIGRDQPGGLVCVTMVANYDGERVPHTLDPDSLLGLEINTPQHDAGVNPMEIVTGERDGRVEIKSEEEQGGVVPKPGEDEISRDTPAPPDNPEGTPRPSSTNPDNAPTQVITTTADPGSTGSVRFAPDVSQESIDTDPNVAPSGPNVGDVGGNSVVDGEGSTITGSIDDLSKSGPGSRPGSSAGKISENIGAMGDIDALSGVFPSLVDQQSTFGGLVSKLRGSGDGLIRMLVGDVSLKNIWQEGHRVNELALRKLPDFRISKNYLTLKTRATRKEAEANLKIIEAMYDDFDAIYDQKMKDSMAYYLELKKKYQQQLDGAQAAREVVKTVVEQLEAVKYPISLPKEPQFEPLGDVFKVYQVPKVAALDDRGKKKRKLTNEEMAQFEELIEKGAMDGKDWDFKDACPTTAQVTKLTSFLTTRNETIDAVRQDEENARAKAYALYQDDLNRWEKDEKQRKIKHDRVKKESRKVNLRLFGFEERIARMGQEFLALDLDMNIMREMKDMNERSKDRFKIMRVKLYLESERRTTLLKDMKVRLLKSLDARKRAMDAPAGAVTALAYAQLTARSEETLRLLRVDIFSIKQGLVSEGVRLRHFWEEEASVYYAELARVRTLREIINQRVCIDRILARNRYEILNLYEDLDKLRLMEASRDDRGVVGTVDNLGERYSESKVWESPGVVECLRQIELRMAKVAQAEGVLNSVGNIQKYLLESVTVRYTAEMVPVRDCWFENSDYERARGMVHDAIKWVAMQRQRLAFRERERDHEIEELRMQLSTAHEQIDIGMNVQEFETASMVESTGTVVKVLQRILDEQRESARTMRNTLEKSVSELSKECQVVREELFNQKLVFDERTKILWAVIGTLQATVQQLSVKMEILTEERDKTVLTSRLMADKLRHQLRVERRHCANLIFVLHAQKGYMHRMDQLLSESRAETEAVRKTIHDNKAALRREVWEHVFVFTRLSTDVDALFEFFANRLANLAGARKSLNDALARNGASAVLAAMCRSPRLIIRKWASRALGNMGWDGYIETRIILWDCVMYWKMFKADVMARERDECERGFKSFKDNGRFESILNISGNVDEFKPSGNVSLRTIIKQRRQWALRAVRRNEGPNNENLKILNVASGAIPALLELCLQFGESDWEVARNCALAICIASYESQNHKDMVQDLKCVEMLVRMCANADVEVQTHAAVTLANLAHDDERAQTILGNCNAIPALLQLCQSPIVDLMEASTCALSNLTSFCDANCRRVLHADGVKIMVKLITQPFTENLLDIDQNDEVQANAAEMLANVSRFHFSKISDYFDGAAIDSLIFMSASKNLQVRRHAPLVLGNIAQGDVCRAIIGDRGGIESLFLILEDPDQTVCANALWALCNLMWHPPNQAHAGRFIPEIYKFFSSTYYPIKSNAVILMANVLYYNNPNRIRFLETEYAMETVMDFVRARQEPAVVEASLRALLSLSYVDYVAMWLGVEAKAVPVFISYLKQPYLTRNCMVYSLEIICNLCVHHSNRLLLLNGGAIEAMVELHADDDLHVQRLSVSVIEYLEDVTPVEVMARRKAEMGLERMVVLATDKDPLVRTIAAETIGEEVWHDPSKQALATEIGGVDALLAIVNKEDEAGFTLLPALWSLRNIMHENNNAQSQFGYRDGIFVVVSVLARCVSGVYKEQTEHILEAGLSCLVSAILNDPANSYRLLVVGLDAMMDLADSSVPELPSGGVNPHVYQAMHSEGVVALAKAILLMLGPFNFIVCRNCHRKQELLGTSCMHCGHQLRVEPVDKKDSLSFKKAAESGAVGKGGTGTGKTKSNVKQKLHGHARAAASSLAPTAGNMLVSASVPSLSMKDVGSSPSGGVLLSQTMPANSSSADQLAGQPILSSSAKL